jgi:hypothetical protein
MVEFVLLVPVWMPLLIGTWFIGFAMLRQQQSVQMARDLGSMYSRGVDFAPNASTMSSETLTAVTQAAGQVSTGGNSGAMFSTIEYVGIPVCTAAGYVNAGVPTAACINYGKWVFTQQYYVGPAGLLVSNFGTPSGPFDTNYYILLDDYVTKPGNVATFGLIPKPADAGTDGYQSGKPVYIVELSIPGPKLAGYVGGDIYAYSVF